MKRQGSYLIFTVLVLCGCTTKQVYTPAPQHYREKGTDNTITITGKLDQTLDDKVVYSKLTSKLTIYFDGVIQITGFLDNRGFGDFDGNPYNGKKTSASCNTKPITKKVFETRCTVFIDNERTITLTM